MSRRRWLPLFASALALAVPAAAFADTPPPPPPDSWAGQFLGVAQAMRHQETCIEHCFALEHLKITGSAATGALEFEIEGGVLANGQVDVPLFGPPGSVRIDDVTLGGAPALVAFDADHYFIRTDQKRFTIKGKIKLGADRSLSLPGPFNTVDSALSQGRVTEGAQLSGVIATTLHFDAERPEVVGSEPPVFQLSRALRVSKRNEFEYHLTMQSGADLGMVRLPLRYGEHVLEVSGSVGWKVEGEDLLIPTKGRSAEVTITGEITKLGSFQADSRSPFEWWLLEADPEHRVLATGDAKQHDSAESPISRREPNSKLFLVSRGQHLDVTVQTLATLDVLAGVVQTHTRTLVLTASGDLVSDDNITYDNSGIDYLLYTAPGKPIFLSTDGTSELLLHKDGTSELMVPLRLGTHNARLQSLDHSDANHFGGALSFDGPSFPLTTSHASVTLGLPKDVHALAITGGDEAVWSLGLRDALAAVWSLVLSLALLRGNKKRALGFATMTGLWFVSQTMFYGLLGVGALALVAWLTEKLFDGRKRTIVRAGLAFAAVMALFFSMQRVERSSTLAYGSFAFQAADDRTIADLPMRDQKESAMLSPQAHEAFRAGLAGNKDDAALDRLGNFPSQLAKNGIVDGVRPVAMPLPSYDHGVTLTRELVTSDRPFQLTVWYITDTALALLGALWLACALALGWSSRDRLRAWRDALRTKLAPPAPAPAVAVVAESAAIPAE